MVILGIDFETSGQNPDVHSVVECGMVLWETDLRMPLRVWSHFVYTPNAIWEPGASDSNGGITQEYCRLYGKDSLYVLKTLLSWYGQADVACAHNGAAFDRLMFNAWCDRYGFELNKDENKVWIDTLTDIDVPAKWSRKLSYLAMHYGIMNPFPHRAFADALTMLMILDKHTHGEAPKPAKSQDINVVMELARSPIITVQAQVPYEQKDEAKFRGYYWRPEPKQWVKHIKACRLEHEREHTRSVRVELVTYIDAHGEQHSDELHHAGFPIRVIPK